jgi:sigma-E factor negative regulatory protein RseB
VSRLRGIAVSASALALAGFVVGPAALTGQRSGIAGPDDSPRAVRLLHRAVLAHANLAYRGTRLVSAWGKSGMTTVVLSVRHLPGQGTAFRVQSAGMGPSSVTFVAQRELDDHDAVALEGGPLGLLVHNYALSASGHDRVAGRLAWIVTATHDGLATGRFWIDRSTGLLVRREVYDADHRLVTVSTFLDLRIEQPGVLVRSPIPMPQPGPAAMSVADLSRLNRRGWDCLPRLPGGFRATDVQRMSTDSATVQTSYSDGLSTVSVFEQHGALAPEAVQGYSRRRMDGTTVYVRPGLPTYLTWASGRSVYTAVTDAPATYLPRIVRAYPKPDTTEAGLWDRLQRGSGRLVGWVAPAAASSLG